MKVGLNVSFDPTQGAILKSPQHPAALMVKDLRVSDRITVVEFLAEEPTTSFEDTLFSTITITKINPTEGTFDGYDTLHQLVTKSFEKCGIPDTPFDDWSEHICTLNWEIAMDLLREHRDATRELPNRGSVDRSKDSYDRQLVGVHTGNSKSPETIKPSWEK